MQEDDRLLREVSDPLESVVVPLSGWQLGVADLLQAATKCQDWRRTRPIRQLPTDTGPRRQPVGDGRRHVVVMGCQPERQWPGSAQASNMPISCHDLALDQCIGNRTVARLSQGLATWPEAQATVLQGHLRHMDQVMGVVGRALDVGEHGVSEGGTWIAGDRYCRCSPRYQRCDRPRIELIVSIRAAQMPEAHGASGEANDLRDAPIGRGEDQSIHRARTPIREGGRFGLGRHRWHRQRVPEIPSRSLRDADHGSWIGAPWAALA